MKTAAKGEAMLFYDEGLVRNMFDVGAIACATRVPTLARLVPIPVRAQKRSGFSSDDVEANCEGHFLLHNGRHTNTFINMAIALSYHKISKEIGDRLCYIMREERLIVGNEIRFDTLVGPAVGAIALTHALLYSISHRCGEFDEFIRTDRGRDLRVIYTERDATGKMVLCRGFELEEDERLVAGDDVYTTGGSIAETKTACNAAGKAHGREFTFLAGFVGVNRTADKKKFRENTATLPIYSALDFPCREWDEADCPYCAEGVPLFRL